MTSLANALHQAMNAFNLPPETLSYAALDPHGGYHAQYEDGFPSGSLWRVEGQFLYALIRALEPSDVLELGTWHGASATHILQGLFDNGGGMLHSVDNSAYGNVVIGDMIPNHLRLDMIHFGSMSLEDKIRVSAEHYPKYDFIFEDAMHTAEQVAFVWQHANQLLNPGGVIVSHDAMHAVAGFAVREGIAKAGYGAKTLNVLIDPADCGFAIWRKGL